MIRSIWFEFIKIRSQKKNWVAIGGFVLLMVLVWWGFHESSEKILSRELSKSKDAAPFGDLKQLADGLLFARLSVYPIFCVLMPIFSCMLSGDSISSELQEGNLKLYFARGFSRTQLLAAKFITNYLYILFYSLAFGTAALLIGIACFGVSPVQVWFHAGGTRIGTFINLMTPGAALWAYYASLLYLSVGIMAIGSFSFLLSGIFNRMTIPTVGGLMLYFISFIISKIPMTENWSPYLVTRTIEADPGFYMTPVPYSLMGTDLLLALLYCLAGFTIPVLVLNARDIR